MWHGTVRTVIETEHVSIISVVALYAMQDCMHVQLTVILIHFVLIKPKTVKITVMWHAEVWATYMQCCSTSRDGRNLVLRLHVGLYLNTNVPIKETQEWIICMFILLYFWIIICYRKLVFKFCMHTTIISIMYHSIRWLFISIWNVIALIELILEIEVMVASMHVYYLA